jgi:transketolase
MRKKFAELLLKEMNSDDRINLVVADMGFRMFDEIKAMHPTRFYNVGAAEQLALGMCVGICEEGGIAVAYSITPFLLYRPFEWLRNYLNHDGFPVKLVGSGRDMDYLEDGFTHWACDDFRIMECFSRIDKYWPENEHELESKFSEFIYSTTPAYLNLKRES